MIRNDQENALDCHYPPGQKGRADNDSTDFHICPASHVRMEISTVIIGPAILGPARDVNVIDERDVKDESKVTRET